MATLIAQRTRPVRHTSLHPLCTLCGRCLWNHCCAVETTPSGSPTCELPRVTPAYCDDV